MSDQIPLSTFPAGSQAVVIGASGAIGQAVAEAMENSRRFEAVLRLSRSSAEHPIDLLDEQSIASAAARLAEQARPVSLIFDATGFLHGDGVLPEKGIARIDADAMRKAFAINAIGPALLMKHFLPLLSGSGKAVFASLSAKVGSIGDNHLGGWHSYRASKAALNQLIRTASIELKRRKPETICVALHPGTVESPLSKPFSKSGLKVRPPEIAAAELLTVIDRLEASQSGGFFDYKGEELPW